MCTQIILCLTLISTTPTPIPNTPTPIRSVVIDHTFQYTNPVGEQVGLRLSDYYVALTPTSYLLRDLTTVYEFDNEGQPIKDQTYQDPAGELARLGGFWYLETTNQIILTFDAALQKPITLFDLGYPDDAYEVNCSICPDPNSFRDLVEDPISGKLFLNRWWYDILERPNAEDRKMMVEVELGLLEEGYELSELGDRFNDISQTERPKRFNRRWVAEGADGRLLVLAESQDSLRSYTYDYLAKRPQFVEADFQTRFQNWVNGNLDRPVAMEEWPKWFHSFSRCAGIWPLRGSEGESEELFLAGYVSPNTENPDYDQDPDTTSSPSTRIPPFNLNLKVLSGPGRLANQVSAFKRELEIPGGSVIGVRGTNVHILVPLEALGRYRVDVYNLLDLRQ